MNKIENFVGVYENAFGNDFCDRAIKFFDDMEQAGYTRSRQQEDGKSLKTQRNDQSFFLTEENVVGLALTNTIANPFNAVFWSTIYPFYVDEFDIIKTSERHQMADVKVQKTKIGGGYHSWHYESSGASVARRLLTYILYLNDVDEGGETEFLYYPKRIKPKAGTMILFPGAFTHTHRGNPPISNEKYILTGWVEF